jgi:sec-independent protein translocase protein TatB
MFHNLGWSELVVLGVLGLLIFGPERLPKVASDAVRMLRELRAMARGAAADLKAELGPEMADLDLASLHPRRIVGSILTDDVDGVPGSVPDGLPSAAMPMGLGPGETPPYDSDAT